MRGNKTEQAMPLIMSLVLAVFSALMHVFCILWQSYVYAFVLIATSSSRLIIDIYLHAIPLALLAVEMALSIATLIRIHRFS
jgi:hypothetical protein